jgi:hypothetical protein
MHPQEYEDTLRTGRPAFRYGHKFFARDLGWIRSRVQGGGFCGTAFAAQDYACLLAFEVSADDFRRFERLNDKEWKLTQAAAQDVRFRVREVTWQEYRRGG